MSSINRRKFLQSSALSTAPLFLSPLSGSIADRPHTQPGQVIFFGDGKFLTPDEYIETLKQINDAEAIKPDRYGVGGVVSQLENQFVEITGKEKAIYMPSGTMANQLAIAVLSGKKPKVIVQETSHVFRDEADAAQRVFSKNLVPLAKDRAYFTADELKEYIDHLADREVFQAGIGAVSIENPVRRAEGTFVPLDEIKRINEICKSHEIPMHLDGARLFMTSAWTGVDIKTISSYFDTVYISLYKYLGASAGAILAGSASIIDQMSDLIKIHGGAMYRSWTNAAVALKVLNGFEDRMNETVRRSEILFERLSQIPGFEVQKIDHGTNISMLKIADGIKGEDFQKKMMADYNIRVLKPNDQQQIALMINETLLNQPVEQVVAAFRNSAES